MNKFSNLHSLFLKIAGMELIDEKPKITSREEMDKLPLGINERWSNIVQKQEAYLELIKSRTQGDSIKSKQELFDLIRKKYLDNIQRDKSGAIFINTKNSALITEFETDWQTFQKYSLSAIYKDYSNQLAERALYSYSPFVQKDPMKICNNAMENILKIISAKIDEQGALQFIPDGYIGRRIKSEAIRAKIIDVLSQGVRIQISYTDLKRKFGNIILIEKQSNEGLEEYLDCYAYDLFSAIQQTYDFVLAECAGLNTFVYSGDIIGDSRPFCIEHVNGVYSRKDIEAWRDQDWQGKNWDVPFEISRGGYNCRHQIMWIPDEAADYFGEKHPK
jgi:hypothetical protein